ncbi:MAG: polysaccharide biosynthesis protein [Bacteroidales bacterium]|nr:polysaccharide biosynthesis protein [Bacteroidales bacterium]
MKPFEKLTSWYFSRRALPYWSVLFIDVMVLLACGLIAFAVEHGTLFTLTHFFPLLGTECVYIVLYLVGFRLFHTYSGVIRFSSFIDLWRIGLAISVGVCLALICEQFLGFDRFLVPLTPADLLLQAVMAAAVMWTVRIWVKTLYEDTLKRNRSHRALVYGVQDDGIALAKSINNSDRSPYQLYGFLADNDSLNGHMLLGHPIYSVHQDPVDIMTRRGIDTLLVSRHKTKALRSNDKLVNSLISAGIKIMIFPQIREMGSNDDENGFGGLREVNVEDLLPRDEIEVDMDKIGSQLRGRSILVTGAAGSIGSELSSLIAGFAPSRLVLIDQAETPLHDMRLLMQKQWPDLEAHTIVADITNAVRMDSLFERFKPEYVFHAAAYKHVPMMEDNPSESVANNVQGTRVVADLAVKHGTRKFVMVSTDKAVNPTNVMGCSKRICEIYVQSLDSAIKSGQVKGRTGFVTTRFGNVLGSNGSVIPLFKEQIKAGGPVTVTHPEIIRFFMLIPEACKLVLEAGTMGNGGEIFVFDMGKPVRIVDLARRMITMSGAKDIEICFTGLRDGEKLYEEVLNDKEVTLPTFHPKIKIARVRSYAYSDASRLIGELIDACAFASDMEIVRRMKEIVPEFHSQHSPYEILDAKPGQLN